MITSAPPAVGSEWVRRRRDSEPSQRVRVLEVRPTKTTFRVLAEFVDEGGRTEDIPGSQLRAPWAEVAAFDELMVNRDRVRAGELTDTEEAAIEQLFIFMRPEAVADLTWDPGILTVVDDRDGLSNLLGTDCVKLLAYVETFEEQGSLWVSADGTRLIAEQICRHHASRVLGWVHDQEFMRRRESLHGQQGRGRDPGRDADRVYEYYMRSERHTYDLLRQWCGQRAIALDERIRAADDEIRRLDQLLAHTLELLAKHNPDAAQRLAHDHEAEQIRPSDVRPMVERRPQTVLVQPRRRFWQG